MLCVYVVMFHQSPVSLCTRREAVESKLLHSTKNPQYQEIHRRSKKASRIERKCSCWCFGTEILSQLADVTLGCWAGYESVNIRKVMQVLFSDNAVVPLLQHEHPRCADHQISPALMYSPNTNEVVLYSNSRHCDAVRIQKRSSLIFPSPLISFAESPPEPSEVRASM